MLLLRDFITFNYSLRHVVAVCHLGLCPSDLFCFVSPHNAPRYVSYVTLRYILQVLSTWTQTFSFVSGDKMEFVMKEILVTVNINESRDCVRGASTR